MPRGRFISKKIVSDYRLNSVPIEAELLFYKMVTHLDREGRLQAEPRLVNNTFYALRNYTDEQVEGWLNDLASQKKVGRGLVELYEVEDHKYLWMPGFEGEQQGLHKEREAPSDIPPPPTAKEGLRPSKQRKPTTEEPISDIVDENLAAIVNHYESNIGIVSPSLFERLKDIAREYPDGWFQKAVDEAVQYGARGHNLRYIEKILERWHAEGIGSLETKPTEDLGTVAGMKVEE